MRLRLCLLCFFASCLALAQNQLPAEQELSALMLNQNDPLLYEQGVIEEDTSSSLCGPASAINWLQLERRAFTKDQQVELLKRTSERLSQLGINLNNGLIEPQLMTFLQGMNELVGIQSSYTGRGRFFAGNELTQNDLLSDQAQILLLKFESRAHASGPTRPAHKGGVPPRSPGRESTVIRGFHFVLKVYGNAEAEEILFLDPENPEHYSRARIEKRMNPQTQKEELRLLPLGPQDLKRISQGKNLLWTILSSIEKDLH